MLNPVFIDHPEDLALGFRQADIRQRFLLATAILRMRTDGSQKKNNRKKEQLKRQFHAEKTAKKAIYFVRL